MWIYVFGEGGPMPDYSLPERNNHAILFRKQWLWKPRYRTIRLPPSPGHREMRSLCLVVLVHNRWVMAPWAKQRDIRKVTGGEKGEVSLPAFRFTVWHHPISIGWPLQWSDGFMVNGGTSLSAHLSAAYFPIRFIFLLNPIRWCWVYLVNQLQKQRNGPITWGHTCPSEICRKGAPVDSLWRLPPHRQR